MVLWRLFKILQGYKWCWENAKTCLRRWEKRNRFWKFPCGWSGWNKPKVGFLHKEKWLSETGAAGVWGQGNMMVNAACVGGLVSVSVFICEVLSLMWLHLGLWVSHSLTFSAGLFHSSTLISGPNVQPRTVDITFNTSCNLSKKCSCTQSFLFRRGFPWWEQKLNNCY